MMKKIVTRKDILSGDLQKENENIYFYQVIMTGWCKSYETLWLINQMLELN